MQTDSDPSLNTLMLNFFLLIILNPQFSVLFHHYGFADSCIFHFTSSTSDCVDPLLWNITGVYTIDYYFETITFLFNWFSVTHNTSHTWANPEHELHPINHLKRIN